MLLSRPQGRTPRRIGWPHSCALGSPQELCSEGAGAQWRHDSMSVPWLSCQLLANRGLAQRGCLLYVGILVQAGRVIEHPG